MEELRHTVRIRHGVHPSERGPHEPGCGRQVARQPDTAHTAAVRAQIDGSCEPVLRNAGRHPHVVRQMGHLVRERRTVGQHPDRVVVDMQAGRCLLHRHCGAPVGYHPVQGREGQLPAEGLIDEIDNGQGGPRIVHGGACPQDPRDELERRDVASALDPGAVDRLSGEVQAGHAQTVLVHRVKVQRVPVGHQGHAYHRAMAWHLPLRSEAERVPAGHDDDLLTEGHLQIQVASEEVVVPCSEGSSCAHTSGNAVQRV